MYNYLLPDDIHHYICKHTTAEDAVLQQVSRNTHVHQLMPQMLSGHEQGVFLEMISILKKPKTILEIGTFTGYSAICLAKGLQPNGKIICIEKNEELEAVIRGNFDTANMAQTLDLRIGNAMQIVDTIHEPIDLVFIDADKQNYLNYFIKVFDKLNTGGLILADNVLWRGNVTKPNANADTLALQAFNTHLAQSNLVYTTILPIRDGITMAIKK